MTGSQQTQEKKELKERRLEGSNEGRKERSTYKELRKRNGVKKGLNDD